MNQVNLIVDCRVDNLRAMPPAMQARQGASFVALILNAPDDITDVYLRVSSNGGSSYLDFPCWATPNGDWRGRILGTAFPNVSAAEWYEIRARDADGNTTALGRGKCVVDAFSASDYEPPGGNPQERVIQTLLDETGAKHPIVAVQDELGEWTYKIGAAI